MKLKKFKEKDNKRIGIIVFTITCILMISGAILYRTFAIFEVKTNQNVINGTVQDPGDIYFAFYQKNEESGEYEIQKEMPNLKDGYVLDEVQSYCGVSGEKDPSIEVYLSEDGYIKVGGMKTSRTKCNLYFAKGVFIQGKGIPVVKSDGGLYEVTHSEEETSGMENGWQTKEYRFAGVNPNNYVWFNDELWRIIGLVNVKVKKEDENEEIEQRLKIMKAESIGKYTWDKDRTVGDYSNDWTKSSLMKLLNGIYYERNVGECFKWPGYGNDITEKSCDFTQTGLKEESKNLIDSDIIWNIGGWNSQQTSATTIEMYLHERGTETYNEQPYEWKEENTVEGITFHSIGLFYPSDVGYGTSNRKCLNMSIEAGNNPEAPEYKSCLLNDWMFNEKQWIWNITPSINDIDHVYRVDNRGFISSGSAIYDTPYDVYPTLYLKPNVKIISGTGTIDNSYQLAIPVN